MTILYKFSQGLNLFRDLSAPFAAGRSSAFSDSYINAELAAAEMLLKREDYESALVHLDFLSRVAPGNPVYAGRKAAVYMAMGKPEFAIRCLESAALKGDMSLRLELAEAYKESGDFTKAAAEYEKLLGTEADPDWVRRQIVNITRQKLQAAGTLSRTGSTLIDGMPRIPDSLLFIAPDSRCAIVDKKSQTLFLYRSTAAGSELERTFACSTGAQPGGKIAEGDARTPEGIYFFRVILPLSRLPEIYGRKAITLDYPNAFDRLEGKSGDGIWLHATNEPIRAYLPNQTRGCVVVSNEDIEQLSSLLKLNETPLVIIPEVRYSGAAERKAELESIRNFLSEWKYCWESRQLNQYAALYSSRFRNAGQDVTAWKAYKDFVFSRAGTIRLDLQLQSVIRNERYAVVTLHQSYHSERFASTGTKRLFIVREGGGWKILAEEMNP